MRNTDSGTWAALVQSVREAANLPKVELARRLNVDRATISRWETGTTRPEDSDVVYRFALLFGIDLDDALVAAGLRPRTSRQEPQPPMDPQLRRLVEIFNDEGTSESTRQQIIAMVRALNELAESQPRRPKRKAV